MPPNPSNDSATPLTDAAYGNHPVLDTQTGNDAVRRVDAEEIEKHLRSALATVTRERDEALKRASHAEQFASKVERGEVHFAKRMDEEMAAIAALPTGKTIHESISQAVARIITERDTALRERDAALEKLSAIKNVLGLSSVGFEPDLAVTIATLIELSKQSKAERDAAREALEVRTKALELVWILWLRKNVHLGLERRSGLQQQCIACICALGLGRSIDGAATVEELKEQLATLAALSADPQSSSEANLSAGMVGGVTTAPPETQP